MHDQLATQTVSQLVITLHALGEVAIFLKIVNLLYFYICYNEETKVAKIKIANLPDELKSVKLFST